MCVSREAHESRTLRVLGVPNSTPSTGVESVGEKGMRETKTKNDWQEFQSWLLAQNRLQEFYASSHRRQRELIRDWLDEHAIVTSSLAVLLIH